MPRKGSKMNDLFSWSKNGQNLDHDFGTFNRFQTEKLQILRRIRVQHPEKPRNPCFIRCFIVVNATFAVTRPMSAVTRPM